MYQQDESPSQAIGRMLNILEEEFRHVRREKAALESMKSAISYHSQPPSSNRVKLDVGGTLFSTTIFTLTKIPDCYFGTTFSERWDHLLEPDGTFFIDRDPTAFPHILNFLRDYPSSVVPKHLLTPYELEMLRIEANFYSIQPLVEKLLVYPPPPTSGVFPAEDTYEMVSNMFGDE